MSFRTPGADAHVAPKHEPRLLRVATHVFAQGETRTELTERWRDAAQIATGVAHDKPGVAPCPQVAGVGALEGFARFFDGGLQGPRNHAFVRDGLSVPQLDL